MMVTLPPLTLLEVLGEGQVAPAQAHQELVKAHWADLHLVLILEIMV
jgi:hypothetical protein